MPPKKSSKIDNEVIKKISDNVMSKVFARMNKPPSTTTKKRRHSSIKKRKFGDLPNSDDSFDDSSDSDYEPIDYDDYEPSKKKWRIFGVDKQSAKSKKSTIRPTKRKSNEKLALTKRNLARIVDNFSSDDENKPSTSSKIPSVRNFSKKNLGLPQQRSSKIKFAANISVSGGTSDAGSTTSSGTLSSRKKSSADYLSKNNFTKSLKRPSLNRFRSSSFSENLESLANVNADVLPTSTKTMNKIATDNSPYVGNNIWGEQIPVEVLSNIFRFGMLAENGAVPFLLK